MPRRKKTSRGQKAKEKEANPEEIQVLQKKRKASSAPASVNSAADDASDPAEEVVDPDVRWVAPKNKRKAKQAAPALDWELVNERWIGDGNQEVPNPATGATEATAAAKNQPQEGDAKRRLRRRKR